MIKLYNYDKETLKFKRILERKKMPDRYEFCSLTKIPKYDEETQYLEYSKQNDDWIIKDIEVPVIDIEKLKEAKIKEIKQKCEDIIYDNYPLSEQLNIAIFGTEGERNNFKVFKENITNQYNTFVNAVNELKATNAVNNYSFEYEKGEQK